MKWNSRNEMEQQTIINRKRQSYKMEQQTKWNNNPNGTATPNGTTLQMEQQTPKYVHGLYYCSDPRVIYDVTMFLNKAILSSSLTNTYFVRIQ